MLSLGSIKDNQSLVVEGVSLPTLAGASLTVHEATILMKGEGGR
jgi:hypothetical protein